MISNDRNINILKKIRNAKNTSTLSQIAAEAALDSLEYTNQFVRNVAEAREEFIKGLRTYPLIHPYESSANFVFIRAIDYKIKHELITFLENRNIFVRDYGHVKGTEGFFRITIGTSDQMRVVLSEVGNYFNQ